MQYKSKYTGAEIDSILDKANSGSGIAIVDSVDKLDPSAELGSLASVIEPGSIKESSVRDLYQPDASMLDQETGTLTSPELLSSVSSVNVFAPQNAEGVVESMVYLVTRDFSMTSQNMAMIGIIPQQGVMAITMTGGYDTMQQLVLAEYSQDTMSYIIHNDQVDAFNAVLANGMDWCYFGNPEGGVITEEQFATIDLFISAVAGIPGKAHVYLKKDKWEELYAKDFEKLSSDINKLDTGLNDLDAKIPTKVSQLENDSFYIPFKKKSIIKISSASIRLENNTETHIKQCVSAGLFDIDVYDINNHAILYIPVELGTTIRVIRSTSANTLLQKSFDCGLVKFEFQSIDGHINIKYTSIPQVRIDYIFKLGSSEHIHIHQSGGVYNHYYLDGNIINPGTDILGEGEHHFTMISDISAESEVKYYGGDEDYAILGPSFVTKIILGNSIKNLPKIQNCPLLAEIQLPQSLKYAEDYGGYFSNTPLLQHISVYTTDMLFRMSVGYSSTTSPGSRGLFSAGKKLKRYDDLYGSRPIVAPADVRVALEGIWDGIEGLTSNQGIIYPNGLLSAGLHCMGVNVPFIAIPRNTNICDISFQLENYGGSYNLLENKYLAYISGDSSRNYKDGFIFEDQFSIERVYSLTIDRSFSEHLFSGIQILNLHLKTRTIPKYAFSSSTVSEVYLENTVTIENGAFNGCKNITKFELPDTLKSIRDYAFYNCTSLNCVDFSKSTTIPYLGLDAFHNVSSSCKIIVPDALYDEWIAATNWSTYADYIIKKSDWDVQQVSE